MTFTEALDRWLSRERVALESLGQLTFRRWTDRDKASAQLALECADGRFVELLLWDTGEAEFGYGDGPTVVDEHVELSHLDELQVLLEAFVRRAKDRLATE